MVGAVCKYASHSNFQHEQRQSPKNRKSTVLMTKTFNASDLVQRQEDNTLKFANSPRGKGVASLLIIFDCIQLYGIGLEGTKYFRMWASVAYFMASTEIQTTADFIQSRQVDMIERV